MTHFDGKLGHKYNHHDVQNELLNIMGAQVLREKLAVIHDRKFFLIVAVEETEISNKEQLSFCVRAVGDNLNVYDNFLGFYENGNTNSETVFNAIKYTLLRCSMSLDDCQRSNILWIK